MKNYYAILNLHRTATEQEIRQSFRRLALSCHPDRHPDAPAAEEKFKEIVEAYSVLMDPAKRRQYNAAFAGPKQHSQQTAFRYSQQDIFQEILKDPRFHDLFHTIFKEFDKAGMRSGQQFFHRTFFGNKGFSFSGAFFWSISASRNPSRPFHGRGEHPSLTASRPAALTPFDGLKEIGRQVGRLLTGSPSALPEGTTAADDLDLNYSLHLRPRDAITGTAITIAIDRGQGKETIKVKIPPSTKDGSRLRLRGKGRQEHHQTGDLYIAISVAEEPLRK